MDRSRLSLEIIKAARNKQDKDNAIKDAYDDAVAAMEAASIMSISLKPNRRENRFYCAKCSKPLGYIDPAKGLVKFSKLCCGDCGMLIDWGE